MFDFGAVRGWWITGKEGGNLKNPVKKSISA
jgi:hypothetical protein